MRKVINVGFLKFIYMVKIIFFDGYIIIVDLGILIFSEINEIKSFIFIVILNNFFNIV